MTLKLVRNVVLCDCCVSELVNGDTSSCDYHGCHDNIAPMQALYKSLKPWHSVMLATDADGIYSVTDFSLAPCDGCREQLAGARTDANVYSSPSWYAHLYGTDYRGEQFEEYVPASTRAQARSAVQTYREMTAYLNGRVKARVTRGIKCSDGFIDYTGD